MSMATIIDHQGRHYGNIGYRDNVYANHLHSSPQFSDPWGSHSSSQPLAPTYATSMPKQEPSQALSASYSAQIAASGPSLVSGSNYSSAGFGGSDLLSLSQDVPRSGYAHEGPYQTSPQTTAPTHTTSFGSSSYPTLSYAQSLHHQQQNQQDNRKVPEHENTSRTEPPSFGELDASHGMLALSHQNISDITPRNLYDARNPRTSSECYGFPQANSVNSSLSGPSHRDSYPYYSASVASADSATEYSSTASDTGYDPTAGSRTLPRPSQLVGANLGPPVPQSMMTQFSSKLSTNSQKKHKCKVCDKRFTRPSSLQTHTYSHTGEKPHACVVDGCGRQFSVVSNLRRHSKVHKGEVLSVHSDDE